MRSPDKRMYDMDPPNGQTYRECWRDRDVAFWVVPEAVARGTNRRVKFWNGVRALFEAWSTEFLTQQHE